MNLPDPQAFRAQLPRRFWLRWHMTLMLATMIGVGLLANHLLLAIPVHGMLWRWLIALFVSYLAFFLSLRLWLAYIGVRPIYGHSSRRQADSSGPSILDGADLPIWSRGGSVGGGGGRFGGAGASGSWVDGKPATSFALGSSGSHGSGGGGGFDFDLGGDGVFVIVLGILVLALVASILGAAIYMVVAAPALLSDAAFSALLATGVARSVNRASAGDWEGSVLKATWKPLALVALFTVVAGVFAAYAMPGARTLGEVLMLYR